MLYKEAHDVLIKSCVKSVLLRNSLHSGEEDGHWCIFSTMSSVFLRDVGGLAPFDCSDTA